MSRGEQKTESLFAGEKVAANEKKVFSLRGGLTGAAIQVIIVEDCLTASALVVACCDIVVACDSYIEADHGFETGLKGQFTTSCADLPSGLCLATDYFVIDIDDCTYKVASSRANAVAGTAVAIADAGTGTHTFTPTCADCTSGTVTVRYSVDDVTYTVDAGAGLLDTPGVILAAGLTVIDNSDGLHYNSIEVEVDVTDSQWVVDIDASGKV